MTTKYVLKWMAGQCEHSQEFDEAHQVTTRIKELVRSCPSKIWTETITSTREDDVTWGLGKQGNIIIYYKRANYGKEITKTGRESLPRYLGVHSMALERV